MGNPVTLDFTKAQPIDASSAPQGQPGISLDFSKAQPITTLAPAAQPQPSDYSISKDLTGSTADEWRQWDQQRQEQFLKHPIISTLSNLGHFAWGGAKAVDELSPASIQRLQQDYENFTDNFHVYQEARKQGKSVREAMQIAGDASANSNPLQLFKPPDEKSDDTEHAIFSSVSASQGPVAGSVAVAFKRVFQRLAEDYKRDPAQAAGNLAIKILPVVLSAGLATPETAALETESAVSEANEARTLSNLKKPGIVRKVVNPGEAAKTSGAIKGETAIRQATGNVDTAVPVRRSFGSLADELKAEAKPVYQKMDEATGGRWDANKNARADVETALRRESDADKLGELRTRKADLLDQQKQLQDEATQKGVLPDDIKNANTNWRRASSLEDLEKRFKTSVDAEDRVNLSSAIQKLKNFDDLDDAMGGKENAARLISRLEDELRHQQAMRAKYTTAKYVAGGAAGLMGMKAFWSIVSALTGK